MRASLRSVAVAGALAIGILAAPAGAQALTCGQTVTHNIKLTADLDCSGSATDGLVVGRSGITINLNGHEITGPGGASYYGIDNSTGYDGVTLENGTVSDYDYDVLFEYTTGSKISHVKATYTGAPGAYAGIAFWYSQNGQIKNSIVSNAATYGFELYYNNAVNLSHSRVVNSNPTSTYAVFDEESRSTINDVTANGAYYGFYIEYPYVGYLMTKNTANSNAEDGFYIYENYPSYIYRGKLISNVANNNGSYGFEADANTTGKKNRARGNMKNCFHVPCN